MHSRMLTSYSVDVDESTAINILPLTCYPDYFYLISIAIEPLGVQNRVDKEGIVIDTCNARSIHPDIPIGLCKLLSRLAGTSFRQANWGRTRRTLVSCVCL